MQVYFLSDITAGNGCQIMHHIHMGNRSNDHKSRWKWPRQGQPSRRDWNLWRRAITEIWTQYNANDRSRNLGHWIRFPHQLFRSMCNYHNDYIVLRMQKKSFQVYRRADSRTRSPTRYIPHELVDKLPKSCVPIMNDIGEDDLICEQHIEGVQMILNKTMDNNEKICEY